jgi:hypothetical protein
MGIQLNFGSDTQIALEACGDIAKYLKSGVDSLVSFAPAVVSNLTVPISSAQAGALSATFSFSAAPSWTTAQKVDITLSVAPQAVCSLSIYRPGDKLFSYSVGEDAIDTPITGGW